MSRFTNLKTKIKMKTLLNLQSIEFIDEHLNKYNPNTVKDRFRCSYQD